MVGSLSLGVASLLLLTALNDVWFGIPAFRALYVVPIWIATRVGGRLGGMLLVVLATLTNFWLDFAHGASTPSGMWGGLIWFLVFSVVTLLVVHVEEALHETERLAHQDALTGLLNRRGLEIEGRRLVTSAVKEMNSLTVVMLDCDQFKRINDDHGHPAGDEALRFLAQTLRENTRSSDIVSRLGGDEFVIVLSDTDEEEARAIMRRTEDAFERGMAERGLGTSLSVGLASLTPEIHDLRALVAKADDAMYRRKAGKRSEPVAS